MLIALDSNSQRITPLPGQRAVCPCCKSEVNAKCGEVNAWHWAHLPDAPHCNGTAFFLSLGGTVEKPRRTRRVRDSGWRVHYRHPRSFPASDHLRDTTPDVCEIHD